METYLSNKLLDLIREESGVEVIKPNMTFEELGMDSLDFILLIQEVRDQIGPVTRQQAQECIKVSELLAIFE